MIQFENRNLGETQVLAKPVSAGQQRPVRPVAVLVEGSRPGLSDQTDSLLRHRLRSTSLLLFAGLLAFLLARLIRINELTSAIDSVVLIGHATITVVTGLVGWRLCRNCAYATASPRMTELVIFGGTGAFFATLSFAVLLEGAARGYVATIAPMWMTLIFTYALFIPNTWRRAAVVIGMMSLIPIAMLLWVKFSTGAYRELITDSAYLNQGILDNVLVMALSATISIWGVHMVNSLRQEAFEAQQLGQYQLRRKLGAGGMGEVYLAEHLLLKRRCAIKIIRADRSRDAETLARFEREVQATAQLTHWNSVEVYDYGRAADGTFYYVMEYLPGMNLDELVRMHGPMPPDRIVHLIAQTCEALREAHGQGLIHRDIKPANIFSAQRGGIYDVAKLLDFGLAIPIALADEARLTQVGVITGTPHFMSPEQALGDAPDERSDIYSLGTVAWFLATGRVPFEDASPLKVLFAHAHQIPRRPSELNPSVSPELDAVIMACMAKNPKDRPQSATELQRALRSIPSSDGWSDRHAAEWWTCHGCPVKKKLDEEILAGNVA